MQIEQKLNKNVVVQDLTKMVSNLPEAIEPIDSSDAYEQAAAILIEAKSLLKKSETTRKTITKPIDKQKNTVMEYFRGNVDNKLNGLVSSANRHIQDYLREQDRIQREKQAEAEEKARKEQARLSQRAQTAADKGQDEKAQALQEQADTTVAAIPEPALPKVKGLSTRENWQCEVTDKMALIKAVAAGTAPATLIEPNTQALNKLAKTLKQDMDYPGTRVYDAGSIAVRSA